MKYFLKNRLKASQRKQELSTLTHRAHCDSIDTFYDEVGTEPLESTAGHSDDSYYEFHDILLEELSEVGICCESGDDDGTSHYVIDRYVGNITPIGVSAERFDLGCVNALHKSIKRSPVKYSVMIDGPDFMVAVFPDQSYLTYADGNDGLKALKKIGISVN